MVRYHNEIVNERARELNRIQAVLEGANIKLASVVTDISVFPFGNVHSISVWGRQAV